MKDRVMELILFVTVWLFVTWSVSRIDENWWLAPFFGGGIIFMFWVMSLFTVGDYIGTVKAQSYIISEAERSVDEYEARLQGMNTHQGDGNRWNRDYPVAALTQARTLAFQTIYKARVERANAFKGLMKIDASPLGFVVNEKTLEDLRIRYLSGGASHE